MISADIFRLKPLHGKLIWFFSFSTVKPPVIQSGLISVLNII